MTWAVLPYRRNYRKMLKVAALVSFGIIMFLLVRRKAIEAEQHRLDQFLEGELHVKTQFMVEDAANLN